MQKNVKLTSGLSCHFSCAHHQPVRVPCLPLVQSKGQLPEGKQPVDVFKVCMLHKYIRRHGVFSVYHLRQVVVVMGAGIGKSVKMVYNMAY
jgi:hypothetical protein